jgi:hypothetical protein
MEKLIHYYKNGKACEKIGARLCFTLDYTDKPIYKITFDGMAVEFTPPDELEPDQDYKYTIKDIVVVFSKSDYQDALSIEYEEGGVYWKAYCGIKMKVSDNPNFDEGFQAYKSSLFNGEEQ